MTTSERLGREQTLLITLGLVLAGINLICVSFPLFSLVLSFCSPLLFLMIGRSLAIINRQHRWIALTGLLGGGLSIVMFSLLSSWFPGESCNQQLPLIMHVLPIVIPMVLALGVTWMARRSSPEPAAHFMVVARLMWCVAAIMPCTRLNGWGC